MRLVKLLLAVRAQRHKLGWSQSQHAGRAGISQQHLSLIERRKVRPELATLERLAQAVGLILRVTIGEAAAERRAWPVRILPIERQAESERAYWAGRGSAERVDQVEALREAGYRLAGGAEFPRLQRRVRVVPGPG